jgi:hypothetical protein
MGTRNSPVVCDLPNGHFGHCLKSGLSPTLFPTISLFVHWDFHVWQAIQQAHHPERQQQGAAGTASLVQKSLRQAIKYIQRRFQWPRPHGYLIDVDVLAMDQPYQIQEIRPDRVHGLHFQPLSPSNPQIPFSTLDPSHASDHADERTATAAEIREATFRLHAYLQSLSPCNVPYELKLFAHGTASAQAPRKRAPHGVQPQVEPDLGIHDPRDEVTPRQLEQYAHPAELMSYGHVPWIVRTLQGYRQLRDVPSGSDCPPFTEHVARWFQYQIGIKPETRASIQSLSTPVRDIYAAMIIYWARAYLALQHDHWGTSLDQGVWVSELWHTFMAPTISSAAQMVLLRPRTHSQGRRDPSALSRDS